MPDPEDNRFHATIAAYRAETEAFRAESRAQLARLEALFDRQAVRFDRLDSEGAAIAKRLFGDNCEH